MMFNKLLSIIISGALLVSGIFIGCKRQSKNSLPLISEFIADSVYMPVSSSDHFKLRVKEVEGISGEIVMFVKSNNLKAYFYNMTTGKYIDSFPLDNYANTYIDSYPLGTDSLMVALSSNEVIAISKHNIKKWDISSIAKKISPFAFIGYLSMESFHLFGDTVACITTTSEAKKKVGPGVPFLKANYDILIKLLPDTAILLAMHNPNPAYFYEQDYYSHVERVYLNSKEIIYSYSHSDTIISFNLFNKRKEETKLNTENFSPNAPFDYARTFDFKYIDSFCLEQSGMSHLFYDKARHFIYSFMKHKGKYIEESGKKNDVQDLPHSLFVLDEQLTQLKEIYIPPDYFGPLSRAFITRKGLYIPAPKSKQNYNDKTLFYRIVIP